MASVNIKPLEDKIVVQASEAETTTASGIVIPDTAKEKPQEGKVLAVGPGRVNDTGTRDGGALSPQSHQGDSRRESTSRTPQEGEGTPVASVSIKPLEDKIVVQASEAETTTASGIVIPDTAKEKPQEGKVLAVGPGRVDDNGNRIPVDVSVGDVVIYSKYGGTEVKHNGEEYLILSARDVLAIVN